MKTKLEKAYRKAAVKALIAEEERLQLTTLLDESVILFNTEQRENEKHLIGTDKDTDIDNEET